MAIEVGAKLPGKVSGITNFGAFVDLEDGKTGLVHISEVSSSFVKDINDILSVGDQVNVKVMSIDDNGKIGLSIRQYEDTKPMKKDQHRKPNKTNNRKNPQDIDAMINHFLKDSDSRLSSLKRNLDGKRGGRGGRRS